SPRPADRARWRTTHYSHGRGPTRWRLEPLPHRSRQFEQNFVALAPWLLYSFPDEVVVVDLSTLRNTSVAFCISSIVPREMRAHCFSSGGKSRPTITPFCAHASRNAAAVIVLPISVKMKFVWESVDV